MLTGSLDFFTDFIGAAADTASSWQKLYQNVNYNSVLSLKMFQRALYISSVSLNQFFHHFLPEFCNLKTDVP